MLVQVFRRGVVMFFYRLPICSFKWRLRCLTVLGQKMATMEDPLGANPHLPFLYAREGR